MMASHRDRYLFLGLWLLYGILIDSGDLTAFNLQQLGVEAIVERGAFFLEGSPTPQLQPGGDVFEYNGHLYAAKQPGQFMAGAAVYAVLHRLGISYFKNFLLAAALVTFFTASLATAAASVCVHRLARSWVAPGTSAWWPWLATLSFAVGSIALPYSGVEHHDALATAYVAITFYLVVELRGPGVLIPRFANGGQGGSFILEQPRRGAIQQPRATPWGIGDPKPGSSPERAKPNLIRMAGLRPFRARDLLRARNPQGVALGFRVAAPAGLIRVAALSRNLWDIISPLLKGQTQRVALATTAGLLLGWTITTSMLPFFMVVVVALYFMSLRQWRLVPWLALGSALGLAPLFFYNTVNFGHPFLVPNIAGSYRDTFFFLDWKNFTGKVRFYATMVSLYVPIVWCGMAGLGFFPACVRHAQIALVALVAVLLGYVLNIETLAGCQYGPRYLLPAMPYAALGIVGFSHLSGRSLRSAAALIVGAVLSCSTIVNLAGALYGTMYCDLRRYAFVHYLDAIRHNVFRTFPLALWLVIPLGLWMVSVVAAIERRR